jgi:hypothetical protein
VPEVVANVVRGLLWERDVADPAVAFSACHALDDLLLAQRRRAFPEVSAFSRVYGVANR